jgi:hypothetical protein
MTGVTDATKVLDDLEARRDGAVLKTEAISKERRLIAYFASRDHVELLRVYRFEHGVEPRALIPALGAT